MNRSPESGHLGRRRRAEDAATNPDPLPATTLTTTTTTATPQAPPQPQTSPQPYPTTSTAGKVRRRRKKRQTNPAGDESDSDEMDADPEAAASSSLTSEGQGSDDQASVETQSMSEVKETTKLTEKEGGGASTDADAGSKSGGNESDLDLRQLKQQADELAQKFVQKVKDVTWKVTHHNYLPDWLKDNDFLHNHHRPPLGSFRTCFKSVFRIHTETGNIWTHLLGCLAFIVIAIIFLVKSILVREDWQEILAYMMFFLGAILCLGFSCLFHTLYCHSHKVSRIFSKLDYSGITFLIVGSFVPWLHYGFYCEKVTRYCYLVLIISLGAICLFVALRDTFGQPKYRPLRAGLYVGLGLSGVIPAIHYLSINGFFMAIHGGGLGWMVLMATLYILGAVLYAIRVPERFFPGKCDIWFQSHQIFHVLVLAAAFVHYHGINTMNAYRAQIGECDAQLPTASFETAPTVTVT